MELARRWTCRALELTAGMYWLFAAAFFAAQLMVQVMAPNLCFGEPVKVFCRGFAGAWALEFVLQAWIGFTFLPFFWLKPTSGMLLLLPAFAYWVALGLGTVLVVRRMLFSA